MSDYKNKILSISGEITREEQLEDLNENHKFISNNTRLESRLIEAFSKLINEIENLEYSLKSYSTYGIEPEKVMEQIKNNKFITSKLRKIACEKLYETKQVIKEVLGTEEIITSGEPERPLFKGNIFKAKINL